MQPPAVQFVTTSDGKRLAYSVTGGGRNLVLVPNTFQHARWAWLQHPRWLPGLATRFRFVHFNYRGQGMSTRGLSPEHSIADWQMDLAAVMDAAEVERGILFGLGHGGHIAVRYALDHPERVDALILSAISIKMSTWTPSLFRDLSRENWNLYMHYMTPRSLTPEQKAIWGAAMPETQTAEEFQIAIREIRRWNLETELPRLNIPTLVLHPRGLLTLPTDEGQRFAASIPGARFVIIDGEFALGDADEGLAAIDSFLANLSSNEALRPFGAIDSIQRRSYPDSSWPALTPREAEILQLIAAGYANQTIAEHLVVSVRTVERHITNLYAKIGVHSKAEATAYAMRRGVV